MGVSPAILDTTRLVTPPTVLYFVYVPKNKYQWFWPQLVLTIMVFMSPGEAISHDKESDRFRVAKTFGQGVPSRMNLMGP